MGLLLVTMVVAACQPARLGARCRTTDFGDDGGDWVLQCRNGRWARALTKQRAAQLLLANLPPSPSAPAVRGSTAPDDDYPDVWRLAPQNSSFDAYGFPNRQCTSFVARRLAVRSQYALPVPPGDAHLWDDRLAPYAAVDATPAVGAIAHWNANENAGGLGAGPLGHVAWVQAVYADGSVLVEQYNLGPDGTYSQFRTRAPRYIHLRDLG